MTGIKKRIVEVLNNGYLMSLATNDKEGIWVADVIYVFGDGLNIYWMSKTFRRHSEAIDKEDNKVAGIITISNDGKTPDLGLQFNGTAERIEGFRVDLGTKFFKKRGRQLPPKPADILGDHSWYKLTPNKICLIDQGNFDRERQDLKI